MGLAPVRIELTELGHIIKQQLTKIESNHKNLRLNTYTIMPNHSHGIIIINNRGFFVYGVSRIFYF